MNAYTPRRNELLTSIKRIIPEIIDRDHNFKSNFHQNILSYQRKIKSIVKYTPEDIINEMIHNYETNMNENSCNCGDSLLISSMIGVAMFSPSLFRNRFSQSYSSQNFNDQPNKW